MPFNLGGPELIIVLVIVLIVFGAGKLPSVMRDVGKGVKEFKRAQTDEELAAAAAQSQSTASVPPAPTSSASTASAPGAAATNGTAPLPAARPSEPAPRA